MVQGTLARQVLLRSICSKRLNTVNLSYFTGTACAACPTSQDFPMKGFRRLALPPNTSCLQMVFSAGTEHLAVLACPIAAKIPVFKDLFAEI